MWPFKKKQLPKNDTEPQTRIEKWEVPEYYVEEFLRRYDSMACSNSNRKLETYLLWKYIKQIIPKQFVNCGMTIKFEAHCPVIFITVESEDSDE